jgi:hypothetical protein
LRIVAISAAHELLARQRDDVQSRHDHRP